MRIGIYIIGFLLGTIIFIGLFSTPLFGNIDILFYRGVILLLLSCIVVSVFLWVALRKLKKGVIDFRDLIVITSVLFSFNLVFFTLVPVTVDRSVSVFVLEHVAKKQNVSVEQMQQVLYTDYIRQQKAVERRFYEQKKSGNIEERNNNYSLTPQGKKLISFFKVIRIVFHIKEP